MDENDDFEKKFRLDYARTRMGRNISEYSSTKSHFSLWPDKQRYIDCPVFPQCVPYCPNTLSMRRFLFRFAKYVPSIM